MYSKRLLCTSLLFHGLDTLSLTTLTASDIENQMRINNNYGDKKHKSLPEQSDLSICNLQMGASEASPPAASDSATRLPSHNHLRIHAIEIF